MDMVENGIKMDKSLFVLLLILSIFLVFVLVFIVVVNIILNVLVLVILVWNNCFCICINVFIVNLSVVDLLVGMILLFVVVELFFLWDD